MEPSMQRNAFIKDILEKWNIQFYVMASLVFQMILVFLAPMRRWVNNGLIHLVIWGVYLLASFFSTFALSLIYNHSPDEVNKSDIFPFWAPFLLVHLGGPHTITALAMEDNNLWHRHLLTQFVQVSAVLVVFYQYKIFQSEWLLPTAIVFLVGIFKGFERISSLHLASSNLVRSYICITKVYNDDDDNGVDEYKLVRRGYEFYQTFKAFIIDHTFIHNECGTEKEWFSKLGVEEAFKVMEMELYFMYQALFTNMIAVEDWENNYFWFIRRFVCHALLVTLALIFFCHSKTHLGPVDIGITYCLLGGALLLDQIAIIHLIFSHWTIAKTMKSTYCYNTKEVVRNKILPVINGGLKLFTVNKFWSGKIIQYSLLNQSLTRRWEWAEGKLEYFSLKEVIDSCLHTETAKVGDSLKKLVVEDIKRKAAKYEDDVGNQGRRHVVMDIILDLVQDHTSDYATFVLLLHVATEICYFTAGERESDEDAKLLCKQISEYLAYLLVLEGKITSAMPGSIGMRFIDICRVQVLETFNHLCYTFNNAAGKGKWCRKRTSRQKACQRLMNEELENKEEITVPSKFKNVAFVSKDGETLESNYHKGKRTITITYNKSVLPKAVELARAMNTQYADPEAGNNRQGEFWKGLSEVWVGLLVYASAHCRGDVYYLNKGGQFYTFVRLLMAHFGLQQSLKGDRSFQLHNEISTRLESTTAHMGE